MLINLTEYFEVQGKQTKLNIPYESKVFNDGYTDYPVVDSTDLNLSITNIGDGKLNLVGEMKATLQSACNRCLEAVNIDVYVSFEYSVVKPDGFHEIDEDEQFFMQGFELDAEALINNELIMSLPMKVLCKEDCKGLCPVCGKNLNNGECGCDTFIPDPRLAAISDIFNAIKEV